MIRLAAHRHLLPFLNNRFDFLQRDSSEAAHQNIAQAQTFSAHRRSIGQGKNVVRRHIQRFVVRKMQPDERVRVAQFQALYASPRFSARMARTAQVLTHLAGFDLDDAPLFGLHHRSRAQATSAPSARTTAGSTAGRGCNHRALRKRNASLQRLLLRGNICFRALGVCRRAYASCDRSHPRNREHHIVPVRIKIISGGGCEPGNAERAVRDCGRRAVGSRNCEPAPRPRNARSGGNVREHTRPRRRHGAFHQHARLRWVDLIPGQRTRSHPRKIRAVGNLAVDAPALVRPERSLSQPLHGFVKLRIRAPQRLNLRNIQHDSSCDRVMRS